MISVAIMAHKKREAFVPDIVEALDRKPEVVWDRKNDRWDTGSRAMRAYDPKATHHLVIQDDALICKDLIKGLEKAVRTSGDHPVCLYTGRVRPMQALVETKLTWAATEKSPWTIMQGPNWGVGVLVPTQYIDEMTAWGDKNNITPNYDLRMLRWFVKERIDCWYTVPSLVEHRHGAENPSLIAGRWALNRRAWEWLGTDRSALKLNWSKPPTPPISGHVPLGRYHGCWYCGFKAVSLAQIRMHTRGKHKLVSAQAVGGRA